MNHQAPRILLADPQDGSRQVVRQQLEAAGYHVDTVTNGGDVILLFELDPPDVLIMDVRLPDMDGFEVCEYVRHETRGSDVTVIIMTEPQDDMTRTYLGPMVDYAGGDYFLAKPCDGKLIAQLLDDLVLDGNAPVAALVTASPTGVVWPTARSGPRIES
jgi:CheY-like chemotaxis protein